MARMRLFNKSAYFHYQVNNGDPRVCKSTYIQHSFLSRTISFKTTSCCPFSSPFLSIHGCCQTSASLISAVPVHGSSPQNDVKSLYGHLATCVLKSLLALKERKYSHQEILTVIVKKHLLCILH